MRKKIVISILAIIAVMLSGICANAEAGSGDNIEISFKVGDETLKINDKDVTVEKPYVVNGVTLVPLRVITEAFGAEVTWNSSDKSIDLKYNDVSIRLVIGNKEAVVDNKKSLLLEAPVIKGGVTMVPMRFITENFGAEVGYDNKTKSITVLKEIANGNSIKDFGLLLKKTVKSKVGDSFYNWSISLPKKLKISYRNFNGTVNSFYADDDTYSLDLNIDPLEDETLESILSDEINDAEDYNILDQGIRSIDGQSYVKLAAKGDKFAYETRVFINDGKVYRIFLSVSDYTTYKNNKDMTNLLDSFSLKFTADGSTEDLSDINSDGLRKYEDKKLKWSVSVMPDMYENKSYDKPNVVSFYDDGKSGMVISMYSIEEGLTLDKWVEDDLKRLKEEYNPELVKVISTEESSLNGIRSKKMVSSLETNGNIKYVVDYYVFGKNYRYEVGYLLESELYKNAEVKKKFDLMLNSFEFSEPDADAVGQLTDPDKIIMPDVTRKIENKENKWSFQIPASLTSRDAGTSSLSIYTNKEESVVFTILAMKGVALDSYIKQFEERIEEQDGLMGTVTVDKSENINEKGMAMKKYLITTKSDDNAVKEVTYIFGKNNNVYFVDFSVKELNWCDKNIKLIDTIWQSGKFE